MLLSLVLASVAAPIVPDEAARAVVRREVIDLRDLPARTRLSAVTIDVRGAVSPGTPQPWVTIAVNGFVVARASLDDTGRATARAGVDERLVSMRNAVEVAAYVPGCASQACRAAVASVRVVGAIRQDRGTVQGEASFAQVATRYRAGMTILRDRDTDPAFAARIRAALAPHAADGRGAGGLVVISRHAPPDHTAPIRFDMGPVGLVRRDGAPVVAPAHLARLTVVQLLRGGDRPVIWVRPGRDVPPRLDLDGGTVALFGRAGRVIAFSAASDDHVLRAGYGDGVDADGALRATRIWRALLLAAWVAASGGLWWIYRRLPKPAAPREATAWAA